MSCANERMNLYTYCLSDEVTPGLIEGATGVMGSETRLIEYQSLKAVVSDFSGERVPVTRENILAHESVIQRVLAGTTPLPFRFGVVTSEARLGSYLSTHEGALLAQLSRVRGAVEMSVKIIWDAEIVKGAATGLGSGERISGEQISGEPEMIGPGAAFLAAKRREVAGDEALKKQAEEIARWLEERLKESVRESSVRVCPTRGMAIAAAHLVARERLEDYRSRVAQARNERAGLRFLTSGAWAPYSFCELSS